MVHQAFLQLLLLFLGFSFVLSSAAAPTSRSLRSNREHTSVPDLLPTGEEDMREGDQELFEVGEGFIHGRMDVESTDYPGTGANNHHD